ncbi:MAG: PQQ-dependent sugar dehydrogenase [Actinobacteria bacterium]|nr:PQQ-dependent sugar dehydrogenase [Actinomycetota bacterium]
MHWFRSRHAVSAAVVAAGLLGVAGLSACGSGAGASSPTWAPQPSYTLEPGPNQNLVPGQSSTVPGPSGSESSAPNPSDSPALDPNVVATGLSAPTGIATMPDGTALVGERTTGRIVQVQPQAGHPVKTIRTLTGLDGSGDGGLLDLATSPNYSQDGLIYAYVTTKTDNEVVDFTLAGAVAPVLTGIPKGASGNTGRLAFDEKGNLFIATSDAGQPALAQTTTSLAGKVLYVDDIGRPVGSSVVYALGLRDSAGLCYDPNTRSLVVSQPGANGAADQLSLIKQGDNYGWPTPSGTPGPKLGSVPSTGSGIGGCAVSNKVFYVTSLDHTALLAANLTASKSGSSSLSTLTASLAGKYGRLLTVVAAQDGSLWLSTSNKDGHGTPIADDERILHIQPNGGGGSSKA